MGFVPLVIQHGCWKLPWFHVKIHELKPLGHGWSIANCHSHHQRVDAHCIIYIYIHESPLIWLVNVGGITVIHYNLVKYNYYITLLNCPFEGLAAPLCFVLKLFSRFRLRRRWGRSAIPRRCAERRDYVPLVFDRWDRRGFIMKHLNRNGEEDRFQMFSTLFESVLSLYLWRHITKISTIHVYNI